MIAEDFLLLALEDVKGKPAQWTDYGLAGAVLVDLARAGSITIEGKKVHPTAQVPNDPVLHRTWSLLRQRTRPRSVQSWIQKLGNKRLRTAWCERMVEQGRLQRSPHRILGLFPTVRYPTRDPDGEADLRQGIHDAVLAGDASDEATVCLAALAEATELRNRLFARGERGGARRVVKQWMRDEPMAKAVGEVIAAVYAAMMVVVVVAATSGSN